MAKCYDSISPELQTWISQQKMFFVSTAPLSPDGHINCSPKGGDSIRVLDANRVTYQDYTGSGAETIAHLRENGRIVIMFCAFDGPPRIVRLHGRGQVVPETHPSYGELRAQFPSHPATRAFIDISVDRVATSCGYSVPVYAFEKPRDILDKWSTAKTDEEIRAYWREHGRESIDGLPALDV